MATTYYSDQFKGGVPVATKYMHAGTWAVTGRFTVPGAALVVNDIIKMCPVPAGARVKDVLVWIPDIDTGSSASLQVGDSDGTPDPNRYITGTNLGQGTAVVTRMNAVEGFDYKFAADGAIEIKVVTAPQTSTTTGDFICTAILAADELVQ